MKNYFNGTFPAKQTKLVVVTQDNDSFICTEDGTRITGITSFTINQIAGRHTELSLRVIDVLFSDVPITQGPSFEDLVNSLPPLL